MRSQLAQLLLDPFDDSHGVGSGLAQNVQCHRGRAIEPGKGTLLFGAILRPANVPHPDGRTVASRDDQVVEGFGIVESPHRAQGLLPQAAGNVAAGNVGVLARDRIPHGGNGDLIGGQAIGINPHIDGPFQTSHDVDLSHAGRAFNVGFDNLIGDLCQLALRTVSGERQRQNGRLIGVRLGNGGRVGIPREIPHHRRYAIPHILSRRIDVASQLKRHHDERRTGPVHRAQLLHAFNGIQDLFDRLRDLGFHFGRGSSCQARADPHGGQVHRRKPIHFQVQVAGHSHHH